MTTVTKVRDFKMPETGEFYVDSDVLEAYERDGYVMVRGLFSQAEVEKLRKCLENSEMVHKRAFNRTDGSDK